MSQLVQPDNPNNKQNNPKPPFYQESLDSELQAIFIRAGSLEGVDDEISLMRFVIRRLLDNDPENIKMLIASVDLLAKLVKIRYTITPEQKQSLREAIQNIINDVGIPLGVTLLSKKLEGDK
jgi:hypothetical protein